MNKGVFFNLNADDQVEYLNNELTKGKSVKELREQLGIGEKALQKIIKSNGFKYSQKLKQYVKSNTLVIQSMKNDNNTTCSLIDKKQLKNLSSASESNIELKKDKGNTLVIPNNYKKDLLELFRDVVILKFFRVKGI